MSRLKTYNNRRKMKHFKWLMSLPDRCQICHGRNGGMRGNENIIGNQIVCDYCHASMLGDEVMYSSPLYPEPYAIDVILIR